MRLAGFALLPVLVSSAFCSAVADVKKAIQSQYDVWSEAYPANDSAKLLEILAPGFTLTTVTGEKIERKEYEAMLNLRRTGLKDEKVYRTRIIGLTLENDRADVLCIEAIISEDRSRGSKKSVLVRHEHFYSDTWAHAGGRWRLLSTVTLQERTITKPR